MPLAWHPRLYSMGCAFDLFPKNHAHRCGHINGLAGGREFAGGGVDCEDHDFAGLLAGGDEPATIGGKGSGDKK